MEISDIVDLIFKKAAAFDKAHKLSDDQLLDVLNGFISNDLADVIGPRDRKSLQREVAKRFIEKCGPKRRDRAIEAMMNRIELLIDGEDTWGKSATHSIHPSQFRKMLGIGMQSIMDDAEGLDFFMDATLDAIDGKLDYGAVSSESLLENCVTIGRARQVPMSAARGRVSRISPTMIEMTIGTLLPGKKEFCTVRNFFAERNGKFENVTRRTSDHGGENPLPHTADKRYGFYNQLAVFIGAQFTMEYFWGIEFSIPGGPGLVVPCTAEGVRAVLKDRDLPTGNKRRQHLRNWVSEHTRYLKERDDVLIRQHLRGRRECKWNGYHCRILPPLSQIREVERRYGELTAPPSVQEDATIMRNEIRTEEAS